MQARFNQSLVSLTAKGQIFLRRCITFCCSLVKTFAFASCMQFIGKAM